MLVTRALDKDDQKPLGTYDKARGRRVATTAAEWHFSIIKWAGAVYGLGNRSFMTAPQANCISLFLVIL
jgi:hypothetical protein